MTALGHGPQADNEQPHLGVLGTGAERVTQQTYESSSKLLLIDSIRSSGYVERICAVDIYRKGTGWGMVCGMSTKFFFGFIHVLSTEARVSFQGNRIDLTIEIAAT
jgi:hypothetical protein